MPDTPHGTFDRISPTAFLTSLGRQFTDIPYATEMARLVVAQRLGDIPIILEARYKATDRALAEYRPKQILELASGFLPRGVAMSRDPHLTYVESDLRNVIEIKQQLVRTLTGERPNLHFAEIDATGSVEQFATAASQHFSADEAVAVVCEGLLMYLDPDEKRRVCKNVQKVLEEHGGVWITTDFTATVGLRQVLSADSELRDRMNAIATMTGRSLPENSFDTLDEARAFASEQGFRVQEHDIGNIVDKLTCLKPLGLSAEAAEKILATRPLFILSLAEGRLQPE